jgi:hypothetical protein
MQAVPAIDIKAFRVAEPQTNFPLQLQTIWSEIAGTRLRWNVRWAACMFASMKII